ncbi:MAG: molybdopterin-dependent oxidoreductase [Candidatus Aminicenantes bacterium]|jgi:predicted molibdopterin-dependent oxidoreductase YjgC
MKISIDGKAVETEGQRTILDVARDNGIDIPSLCDFEGLSPFTGCRLCLVEIKGRRGYPPSCGTYVEEGMEILTDTPKLRKLRNNILELILTEHPSACLICSEKENCDEYKSTIRKVGEVTGCVLCSNNRRCELQDVVDSLKLEKVGFPSVYRDFEIKRGDPFFDRNYNLCILCGRCVRVCHELRGASAITFVNRGPDEVIGTVLDKPLLESGCQFCGACVDVCPTGSLVERGLKYESLPDSETKTICPLCSMGCELDIRLKDGRILSASPSSEGPVNRGQACVKGRFLIRDIVYSTQRELFPLIKKKGEFEKVSWDEALDFVSQKLKQYKAKEIAVIESSQLTCEDEFVSRKFAAEVLKTKNIDTRPIFSPYEDCYSAAYKAGASAQLNFDVKDISKADTIVLAGTDLVTSHPIIWLEVLEAVKNGSKLIIIGPTEFLLERFAWHCLRVKPGSESLLFGLLAKCVLEGTESKDMPGIDGISGFIGSLDKIQVDDAVNLTGVNENVLKQVSGLLMDEGLSVFLFGAGVAQSPSNPTLVSALRNLALLTGAKLLPLGSTCNDRGLFELSRSSSKASISKDQILRGISDGEIKALYCVGSATLPKTVKTEFLVMQSAYWDKDFDSADVFLPAVTFAETEGIIVNVEGRVQLSRKVIEPLGDAKPDWWIFSQLARKMKAKGFDYEKPADIFKEIRKTHPGFANTSLSSLVKGKETFIKEEKKGAGGLSPVSFGLEGVESSKKYPFKMILKPDQNSYRNLSLSTENKGFALIENARWIRMNPEDADKLGFHNGDPLVVESSRGKREGVVKLSEALPRGLIESQIVWSADARVSTFSLRFPLTKGCYPQEPIPVKVKRGK